MNETYIGQLSGHELLVTNFECGSADNVDIDFSKWFLPADLSRDIIYTGQLSGHELKATDVSKA